MSSNVQDERTRVDNFSFTDLSTITWCQLFYNFDWISPCRQFDYVPGHHLYPAPRNFWSVV